MRFLDDVRRERAWRAHIVGFETLWIENKDSVLQRQQLLRHIRSIADSTEESERILSTAEQVARAPAVRFFVEVEAICVDESDDAENGKDQSKYYDEMWDDRSQQWQRQATWSMSDIPAADAPPSPLPS